MIRLRSGFLKKVLGSIVSNAIYKKIGYRIDVHIDKLDIDHNDGETSISTGIDLKLNSTEFLKIMKTLENL